MNQELLNYITSQLEAGHTVEQIKPLILQSGWNPAVVESTFSYLAHAPAPETQTVQKPEYAAPLRQKQPRKINKKALKTTGIVSGIILLSASTGIAAAEQGFAPALSKTYRSTPLPMAWGGMSGKPELGLLQMLESAGKSTGAHSYTMDTTFTVAPIDSGKPVSFDRLTSRRSAGTGGGASRRRAR